jgi:hypothetical protein
MTTNYEKSTQQSEFRIEVRLAGLNPLLIQYFSVKVHSHWRSPLVPLKKGENKAFLAPLKKGGWGDRILTEQYPLLI